MQRAEQGTSTAVQCGRQVGFGELLRRRRRAVGLSQEELAGRSGLSVRSIGNLEAGKVRRPQSNTVRLLAGALGLAGAGQAEFEQVARQERWPDEPVARPVARPGQPGAAAGVGSGVGSGVPVGAAAPGPERVEPVAVVGGRAGVVGWPLGWLGATGGPGPDSLPSDLADFTGRQEQVARAAAALSTPRPAVPVLAISGAGGVGKTCLAVHVAHRLAGHYPDGRLFVRLRDGDGRPVPPLRVADRVLRALGLAGRQIPAGLQERSDLLRRVVNGRRVLLLLDDAVDGEQVRAVLPGRSSCAVLVTSRRRLVELDGSDRLDLGPFSAAEASALLVSIISDSRAVRDPEAVAAVVRHCGNLPLAVRIAGARLAQRVHRPVGMLAGVLADATRRLDALEMGERSVRSCVGVGYWSLDESQRRALRRLVAVDVTHWSPWLAAALLELPHAEALDLLDGLVEARLLDILVLAGCPRYRMHGLIRDFARERAEREEPAAERAAAVHRAVRAGLAVARLCRVAFPPVESLPDDPDPWAAPATLLDATERSVMAAQPGWWFATERTVLVELATVACGQGWLDEAWRLLWGLYPYLEVTHRIEDAHTLHRRLLHYDLPRARRSNRVAAGQAAAP